MAEPRKLLPPGEEQQGKLLHLDGRVEAKEPDPESGSSRAAETPALGAVTLVSGFVCVAQLPQPEPVDWYARDWVAAGQLHIAVGDGGIGKSSLGLDMVARASTGTPVLPGGTPRDPMYCVIAMPEDSLGDITAMRLTAAGADLGRIIAYNTDQDQFQLPDKMAPLRAQVEAVNAGLVLIDPLAAVMNPTLRLNDMQDSRQVLHPLTELAKTTGAAVILVHHVNKSAATAANRIAGSNAILQAARVGLMVGQHPQRGESRVVTVVKSNIGPVPDVGLEFTLEAHPDHDCARVVHLGSVDITAADLFADAANTPQRSLSRPEQAIQFANDCLKEAGGAMLIKDLYTRGEAAGHSKRTMAVALEPPQFERWKEQTEHGPWWIRLAGDDGAAAEVVEDELEEEEVDAG
jgi:hypothetical protein